MIGQDYRRRVFIANPWVPVVKSVLEHEAASMEAGGTQKEKYSAFGENFYTFLDIVQLGWVYTWQMRFKISERQCYASCVYRLHLDS